MAARHRYPAGGRLAAVACPDPWVLFFSEMRRPKVSNGLNGKKIRHSYGSLQPDKAGRLPTNTLPLKMHWILHWILHGGDFIFLGSNRPPGGCALSIYGRKRRDVATRACVGWKHFLPRSTTPTPGTPKMKWDIYIQFYQQDGGQL